eukprot:gene12346-15523_t
MGQPRHALGEAKASPSSIQTFTCALCAGPNRPADNLGMALDAAEASPPSNFHMAPAAPYLIADNLSAWPCGWRMNVITLPLNTLHMCTILRPPITACGQPRHGLVCRIKSAPCHPNQIFTCELMLRAPRNHADTSGNMALGCSYKHHITLHPNLTCVSICGAPLTPCGHLHGLGCIMKHHPAIQTSHVAVCCGPPNSIGQPRQWALRCA